METLESEKAVKQGLNFKFIGVQILILITPAPTSQTAIFRRRGVINQQTNMYFSRLLFFCVVSEKQNDGGAKLCYMMEALKSNNNPWSSNIQLIDNGAIYIDSLLHVIAQMPIQNYRRGDVPTMKTMFPVILLKSPKKLPSVYINPALEGNSSLAFVYNKVNLNNHYSVAVRTACTGNLCDRQRISDMTMRGGSCGCYGFNKNSSNLVIQHYIEIETPYGTLPIDKFP